MNPPSLKFDSLQVSVDPAGHVVRVVLDHGRANEMGRAQVAEWERLAQALETLPARALVTRSRKRSGRGTPIFVAGADVTERVGWSDDEVRRHVRWQRDVLARLRRVPQFHLAVVEGVALGWGMEFLLACDYRIATPEAAFALPETGLGILPGAGGTSELPLVVGPAQALRLGMAGERIDATEALRIGLVQEVLPDGDAAMARAEALVALVARRSPTAMAAYKSGVLAGLGRPGYRRAELEGRTYEHCVSSGDAAIGRAGFKAITEGGTVTWGDRRRFDPE